MSDLEDVKQRSIRWPGFSARLLVVAVVVVGALLGAAAIKGWPAIPFLAADGPKFDPADWCAGHGVPESLCVPCHPELRDKLPWCKEHDVPEALCTLCRPELAERFVMCEEHGLPEAVCPQCRAPAGCSGCNDPSCSESNTAAPTCESGEAKAPQGDRSAEPCRLELPMVRLASAGTVRDAGIEVVRVQMRPLERTVACRGRVGYNENRLAQVHPRVEGIVREVRVDAGDRVEQGAVLAVIDSVQLGEAKAAHLSALAYLELAEKNSARLKGLADGQIIPGKALLEAETQLSEARIQVREARQRLANLGFSESQLDELIEAEDTRSSLTITAPLSGTIVRRRAVVGEAAAAVGELFAVADLSTVWVQLDLYENDLRFVRPGQPVEFLVESLPGMSFQGEITWISPEIDAHTRTVQIRAEVGNPDRRLRVGMYGMGKIETDAPAAAQVVPKTAVQWHEHAPVLFVQKDATLFEPRRVCLGRKQGPFWEVTEGIAPDEFVVTTGSFLLKTELIKGAIGAGCCGE